jgi:dTDP-4-dehydrorhamnose reductase
MRQRLFVTGCDGFVAGTVVHQTPRTWELHALSLGEQLVRRDGLTWHTFDLRDNEHLSRLFREVKPEALIHAAAMADIDFCEANRDVARQVNVGVTEALANLCRECGTKMIVLSTDTVFDGEKGNYVEEDPPRPINFYAETKAAAERIVSGLSGDWVVTRLALVMGLPMLDAGNSFLSRMIPAFASGKEVGAPDNEIRSPIDVITAARALLELAGNDYTGYLHLAGNDVASRFEMARRIAAKLGFPQRLVVARNAAAIPGRAPRPLNVSLSNQKARRVLRTPMRGIEDGLDLVLSAKKGIVL